MLLFTLALNSMFLYGCDVITVSASYATVLNSNTENLCMYNAMAFYISFSVVTKPVCIQITANKL